MGGGEDVWVYTKKLYYGLRTGISIMSYHAHLIQRKKLNRPRAYIYVRPPTLQIFMLM